MPDEMTTNRDRYGTQIAKCGCVWIVSVDGRELSQHVRMTRCQQHEYAGWLRGQRKIERKRKGTRT